MTQWLAVKNWDRFQHYKDRCPPWIKLHFAVLDDYAWGELPDSSKAHLMGIWLLASRNDGRIPNDPAFVGRRIGAKSKVDLGLLIRSGFLARIDSTAPADCEQNAPLEEKRREETEERREETERDLLFDAAWKAYPRRPNNPKEKAAKAWAARVKEGVNPALMLDGVTKYAAFCRAERTEPKYIKMAATFFGPDKHWESDYTPSKAPAQKSRAPELPKYVRLEDRQDADPRVVGLVGSIGRKM